jgi:hypothetical protein
MIRRAFQKKRRMFSSEADGAHAGARERKILTVAENLRLA